MLKPNNKKWKDINLVKDGMFYIEKCRTINTTTIDGSDGVLDVVGATSKNNGNVFFANNKYINYLYDKNTICLIKTGQGSVGDAIYKNNNFIPSNNITIIKKENLNKYTGLFTITLINKCSDRYSYGYIRNDKRILREKNIFPVLENDDVDWQYMEQYIKSIIDKKLNTYKKYAKSILKKLKYKEIKSLEDKEWKEFSVEDVAEIFSGRDIYETERIVGITPYISSTAKNNGIGYFVGNTNSTLERDCITVNRNGSVGYSFFHPYETLISNDCRKLRLKESSKYIALFITNQITFQKEKYNYGYKMGTARLKRQKILLPINNNEEPDYEYMEQYIINMKYKKIKQYLDYLETQSAQVCG